MEEANETLRRAFLPSDITFHESARQLKSVKVFVMKKRRRSPRLHFRIADKIKGAAFRLNWTSSKQNILLIMADEIKGFVTLFLIIECCWLYIKLRMAECSDQRYNFVFSPEKKVE